MSREPGSGRPLRGSALDDLHAVDCLEGLSSLPAGCVDLVFADLPYGRTQNEWDRLVPIEALWCELRRVCRADAPMVFTAIQPFTSLLVSSNMRAFRYEMIWRKNKGSGFLNAKKQPLRTHENVLVFYDTQPAYAPQMTVGHKASSAVPRRKTSNKTDCYGEYERDVTYKGGQTLRYPTSVLDIPVVNNDDPARIHSTQKPEALPEWFIRTYTNPDGLVLDPTAGSGSTLLAAKRLGRRFVGFETDEAMVAKVRERLRTA